MAQMPSFQDHDWYSARDRRSLPDVTPPPKYVENTTRRSDGPQADQRPMRSDGWPAGFARDRRHGTANPHGEWQPGETERSYPKSDPGNAAWYKDHVYQKHDSRWVRKAGPPSPVGNPKSNSRPAAGKPKPVTPVQKAAAKAGAKAVGKASKGIGRLFG
jgi:hypothetical protein